MFRHIEIKNNIIVLKKENESVLGKIKDIDCKLEDLDAKLLKNVALMFKLNNVEKKKLKNLVKLRKSYMKKTVKLKTH